MVILLIAAILLQPLQAHEIEILCELVGAYSTDRKTSIIYSGNVHAHSPSLGDLYTETAYLTIDPYKKEDLYLTTGRALIENPRLTVQAEHLYYQPNSKRVFAYGTKQNPVLCKIVITHQN